MLKRSISHLLHKFLCHLVLHIILPHPFHPLNSISSVIDNEQFMTPFSSLYDPPTIWRNLSLLDYLLLPQFLHTLHIRSVHFFFYVLIIMSSV